MHTNNDEASSSQDRQDVIPVTEGNTFLGVSNDLLQTPAHKTIPARTDWQQWFLAFQSIIPIYIAVHLAFLVTTYLSVLFVLRDFSWQAMPVYTLWQSWHHWDVGHYTFIATHGYNTPQETAFFPLYPLVMKCFMLVLHNPLIAGIVVSNLAGLIMLIVLYRLVLEDFGQKCAYRTVLYLSLFPTAFFFAAAYTESLFLCLSLLSFYHIRRGHWWVAGLFGLLASLTRSAGILMLLPFFYEYLRQRHFQIKAIRFDILAGVLIPSGIALFSLYCYLRFHDFLTFSHAESAWNRSLHIPGYGLLRSIYSINLSAGPLSFQAIRNMTDLVPDLLVLVLIILIFVGPWKFHRSLWIYGLYAGILWIFLQLFPRGVPDIFPLESLSRYLLVVFPVFIVLAGIGSKYRTFDMSYLMVSEAVLFFLLTQFLTGHWVL